MSRLSLATRALFRVVQSLGLRTRIIETDYHSGQPYLLRVYITPDSDRWREWLPGVYLHYFFRGDSRGKMHNHPWSRAVSLILTGGYTEERLAPGGTVQRRRFAPGDVNRLERDTFHRVDLDGGGCWTLFITGQRELGIDPEDGRQKSIRGFRSGEELTEYEHWFDRDRRVASERARYPRIRWVEGERDRLVTIIDEAFGLQPVMTTDELLTFLEHQLRPIIRAQRVAAGAP